MTRKRKRNENEDSQRSNKKQKCEEGEHTNEIGLKLLKKMGYIPGKGLGKNLQGKKELLANEIKSQSPTSTRGLGVEKKKKREIVIMISGSEMLKSKREIPIENARNALDYYYRKEFENSRPYFKAKRNSTKQVFEVKVKLQLKSNNFMIEGVGEDNKKKMAEKKASKLLLLLIFKHDPHFQFPLRYFDDDSEQMKLMKSIKKEELEKSKTIDNKNAKIVFIKSDTLNPAINPPTVKPIIEKSPQRSSISSNTPKPVVNNSTISPPQIPSINPPTDTSTLKSPMINSTPTPTPIKLENNSSTLLPSIRNIFVNLTSNPIIQTSNSPKFSATAVTPPLPPLPPPPPPPSLLPNPNIKPINNYPPTVNPTPNSILSYNSKSTNSSTIHTVYNNQHNNIPIRVPVYYNNNNNNNNINNTIPFNTVNNQPNNMNWNNNYINMQSNPLNPTKRMPIVFPGYLQFPNFAPHNRIPPTSYPSVHYPTR